MVPGFRMACTFIPHGTTSQPRRQYSSYIVLNSGKILMQFLYILYYLYSHL